MIEFDTRYEDGEIRIVLAEELAVLETFVNDVEDLGIPAGLYVAELRSELASLQGKPPTATASAHPDVGLFI